jgi:hypothetical protein
MAGGTGNRLWASWEAAEPQPAMARAIKGGSVVDSALVQELVAPAA